MYLKEDSASTGLNFRIAREGLQEMNVKEKSKNVLSNN
jgi:hypothetical protein